MYPLTFFAAPDSEALRFADIIEIVENRTAAGIWLPDLTALDTLGVVLAGVGPEVSEVGTLARSGEKVLRLRDDLSSALRTASDNALQEAASQWADQEPWASIDVNPMDLAGFIYELRQVAESSPESPMFAVVEQPVIEHPDA